MRQRTRRKVGWPTAAVIRRTTTGDAPAAPADAGVIDLADEGQADA